MSDERTCRFCGIVLEDPDVDFHPTCVEADHVDDNTAQPSVAHPMYGPRGPQIVWSR